MSSTRGVALICSYPNGASDKCISDNKMINSNPDLVVPITTIDELNPTATTSYNFGEDTVFVYENYSTTMNIILKDRTERTNLVTNYIPYITKIMICSDVYNPDSTIFSKRCNITHVNFTENEYENGVVLEITLLLKGKWYYSNKQKTNLISYIPHGSTVLSAKNGIKDLVFKGKEGTTELYRLDDNSEKKTLGSAFGTDGQCYDNYFNYDSSPAGKTSYDDLGPSRLMSTVWVSDFDDDSQFRRWIKRNGTNSNITFQALDSKGTDISKSVSLTQIHYLDFI